MQNQSIITTGVAFRVTALFMEKRVVHCYRDVGKGIRLPGYTFQILSLDFATKPQSE